MTTLGRDERRLRGLVAAVVLVLVAGAAAFSDRPLPVVLVCVAVAVVAVLALWTASGTRLAVGLPVVSAALVVLCAGGATTAGWFTSCLLVVVAFTGLGARPGLLAAGGWVVVFAVQAVVHPDPGWIAWTGGIVLTVVACVAIERQRSLVLRLEEAQAGLAARSAAEERTRIAREMHDVMGHALTVSLLHITSARLALDEDPRAAAEALAEAERLSRRSLEEVRAAVGVLRDGSQPSAPLPGASSLPDLVTSVRRTGTDVDLRVTGDLSALSEVAGLAVYRVVQEALTNVVRHAPDARTRVSVVVTDAVRVRVDSAAPPRAGARHGAGTAGMAERVSALGGTLTAGPGGPGWRVEATWPLAASEVGA
ncbi:sensor histidine kinase [Nocardioides sp. CFH 31398]|uniref:sensor histidine kinase n=1 Tax=Nocardioides sp. CFH 31398 TaxID=2919579 RepID=UPI001F067B3A|nr:histidine kinase [Nocardioides sp. CFH 31398]MCH1867939.1 histidine kinase [Nocardioides sp. CFH 31398]